MHIDISRMLNLVLTICLVDSYLLGRLRLLSLLVPLGLLFIGTLATALCATLIKKELLLTHNMQLTMNSN